MQLIGMLDSPYVRRTAIAATLLGLKPEHHSVSVFREVPRFQTFNPLVKAPTLIADDGTVLTDSSVIVQHLEDVAGRSLRPAEPAARLHDLKITGIAVIACEKAVQTVYERNRRETERSRYWLDRTSGQLATALGMLDAEPDLGPPTRLGGVTAAVAWSFCRYLLADLVASGSYPRLAAYATATEATAPFLNWPIDRT